MVELGRQQKALLMQETEGAFHARGPIRVFGEKDGDGTRTWSRTWSVFISSKSCGRKFDEVGGPAEVGGFTSEDPSPRAGGTESCRTPL